MKRQMTSYKVVIVSLRYNKKKVKGFLDPRSLGHNRSTIKETTAQTHFQEHGGVGEGVA